MLRLTIAAWVGLWFLPTYGMAQEQVPTPPAADAGKSVLPAPDAAKPATEQLGPGKPVDAKPALKGAPATEADAPSKGVIIAEAKIIIRPWNYESDREWDYTLSNARETPPCGYRMTYEEAYNSIPFRRSQYNAQPSYRHDAALELMFGVLRPTTIVRNSTPTVGPEAPYPYHNDYRRRFNGWPMLNPYYVYPGYSLYAY